MTILASSLPSGELLRVETHPWLPDIDSYHWWGRNLDDDTGSACRWCVLFTGFIRQSTFPWHGCLSRRQRKKRKKSKLVRYRCIHASILAYGLSLSKRLTRVHVKFVCAIPLSNREKKMIEENRDVWLKSANPFMTKLLGCESCMVEPGSENVC